MSTGQASSKASFWRTSLAAVFAIALALALGAPAAQASEGINAFKTTVIETNAFGDSGAIFSGVVKEAPSGESFTIETRSGQTDKVVVFPTTKISGHGYEQLSLSSILSGEEIVVLGSLSGAGAIVDATRIFLEPRPGEVTIPSIEFVTEGIVQAQASGESFTIETSSGSIDTVEVSPSTTYGRAHSLPGEAADPPTLSDVRSGDDVGVVGSIAGETVTAASVLISTPRLAATPTSGRPSHLENPGDPEAARNVVFNAPTGLFGNPRAVTQCPLVDFALDECSPNSQAGLITLRADYKGNPNYLLGTAPISRSSLRRR